MKRHFISFALLCASLMFASCGDNESNDVPNVDGVPGTNHRVLIAYFSEPLPDGVDANTSASRVIVDGDLYGSVEYMASIIAEATKGDLVRIQTATPYPGNFNDLASQADNERRMTFTRHLPQISPISTTTMSSSSVILFGGIKCRWQCTRSLMNMIFQAKPSSRSLHTVEADGLAHWMT